MKNFKERSKLLTFIISEIFCLFMIKMNITLYENNDIISSGINFVQFLYFLPMFVSSLYIFLCKNSNRTKIIYSTIGLILYSISLHFFIEQIATLFTNVSGIIHFVEYASKIYFISLPLVGFKILAIKKEENIQKIFFLLLLRIILLLIISLIFNHLFKLKGILYSWPLNDFIFFIGIFLKSKKPKI